MTLADRIGRSLFVALAVGLGWGIRGDFGHLVGAMYPGAVLALAFAYASGQGSLFRWMPVLALLSGLGIATGGMMSYGILHGYAQSDTLPNYAYGFLTLFLQGSAWGTFGCALIGLALDPRPMRTGDWLGWLGSIFLGGWASYGIAVLALGFDINPPRNNISITFMGAAIGNIAWLAANRRRGGLRGAILGYVGFGLGMAVGRLLGNTSRIIEDHGYSINHWNVMEVMCGFIGGFIFSFGMIKIRYPDPPEGEDLSIASICGIIYALGIIPLWHRLGRIDPPAKLAEWSKELQSYGYSDPDGLARTVLYLIDGTCLLGFIGAGAWMIIHFRNARRWAALPALWLSATMLLYQNLNALYFFYVTAEKYKGRGHYINMHLVFWIMFALMVAYVALARPRLEAEAEARPAEAILPPFAWVRWGIATIAVLALTIFLAGYVNGPRTMTTANTRWPVWSASQGPFPGR